MRIFGRNSGDDRVAWLSTGRQTIHGPNVRFQRAYTIGSRDQLIERIDPQNPPVNLRDDDRVLCVRTGGINALEVAYVSRGASVKDRANTIDFDDPLNHGADQTEIISCRIKLTLNLSKGDAIDLTVAQLLFDLMGNGRSISRGDLASRIGDRLNEDIGSEVQTFLNDRQAGGEILNRSQGQTELTNILREKIFSSDRGLRCLELERITPKVWIGGSQGKVAKIMAGTAVTMLIGGGVIVGALFGAGILPPTQGADTVASPPATTTTPDTPVVTNLLQGDGTTTDSPSDEQDSVVDEQQGAVAELPATYVEAITMALDETPERQENAYKGLIDQATSDYLSTRQTDEDKKSYEQVIQRIYDAFDFQGGIENEDFPTVDYHQTFGGIRVLFESNARDVEIFYQGEDAGVPVLTVEHCDVLSDYLKENGSFPSDDDWDVYNSNICTERRAEQDAMAATVTDLNAYESHVTDAAKVYFASEGTEDDQSLFVETVNDIYRRFVNPSDDTHNFIDISDLRVFYVPGASEPTVAFPGEDDGIRPASDDDCDLLRDILEERGSLSDGGVAVYNSPSCVSRRAEQDAMAESG